MSLLGVILGTTTFVSFAGMMTGFQSVIINQLVNNDAHIRVSVREELIEEHSMDHILFPDVTRVFWTSPPSGRRDQARIEYPAGWFRKLEKDTRVFAFSPQYNSQVIFTRGKARISGRLLASDPEKQKRVTNVADYMKEGSFVALASGGRGIIVGDGLLANIGARVGESLLVSAGKAEPVPFKIIGSFDLGIRGIDDTTAFAALADVQAIN